jgi:crossover junction endonuclease MUS81
MLIIDIDYREQKIIKLIDPNIKNVLASDTIYGPVTHNKITFYYKISNLIIGDFIYKNHDTSSVYYIIERKSISDLASSIKDGRFREQKERLSQSNANVIYIIEGNINTLRGYGICKTTLKSSIVNLQIKHKFLVFKTDSDGDSFEYLLLLYKKIKENDGIDFKNDIVTIKKKDSTTSVYINQLTMINGVSKAVANKISEKYNSLMLLINMYNSMDKVSCENLLADIQITEKRKLGKALSKKIYNALMEVTEQSESVEVTEQSESVEVTEQSESVVVTEDLF